MPLPWANLCTNQCHYLNKCRSEHFVTYDPEASHKRRLKSLTLRTASCNKPSGQEEKEQFTHNDYVQTVSGKESCSWEGKAWNPSQHAEPSFDSYQPRWKMWYCSQRLLPAMLHICRPQLQRCSFRHKAHIQEYLDASRNNSKETCLKDHSVLDTVQTSMVTLALLHS